MSIRIIQDTFMEDFSSLVLSDFGKVYPNLPYSGQKPYISLQFVHNPPVAIGLSNPTGQTLQGFMLFTVVTELGEGLENSAIVSQLIAARYPFGRVFDVTGGRIEIPSPPYVMDGFRQDSDWRTPMQVPYRAFF